MDDATLGEAARLWGDKTTFQNYPGALKKSSEIKKVKCNKDESQVLYLFQDLIFLFYLRENDWLSNVGEKLS